MCIRDRVNTIPLIIASYEYALGNILGITPEADEARGWIGQTPVSYTHLDVYKRQAWDTDVVPNPQDPATFASAKLRWAEVETGSHTVVLQAYRELIELRCV